MTSISRINPLTALGAIEITGTIFSYFSPQDITCRLAFVCKNFARYSADERIWQRRAVRQLDIQTAGELFILMKRSWKKACFVKIRSYQGTIEEGIFKKFRKSEEIISQVRYGQRVMQTELKIKAKLNGLGQRIHPNGIIEQGTFSQGDLTQGIIAHPDEVFYEGSFLAGRLHGVGKQILRGKIIEEGTYQRGRLSGQGKRILSDGRIEKGEFKNGWLHGRGMIIWPNGTKEKGIFSNGRLTAERQIILPNGTIVEATIWINGVLHGPGKVTYPNGTVKHVKFDSYPMTA